MALPALRIDEPTVDLAALLAHASWELRPHRWTATFGTESLMRLGIDNQLLAEREQLGAQPISITSSQVLPTAPAPRKLES